MPSTAAETHSTPPPPDDGGPAGRANPSGGRPPGAPPPTTERLARLDVLAVLDPTPEQTFAAQARLTDALEAAEWRGELDRGETLPVCLELLAQIAGADGPTEMPAGRLVGLTFYTAAHATEDNRLHVCEVVRSSAETIIRALARENVDLDETVLVSVPISVRATPELAAACPGASAAPQ